MGGLSPKQETLAWGGEGGGGVTLGEGMTSVWHCQKGRLSEEVVAKAWLYDCMF